MKHFRLVQRPPLETMETLESLSDPSSQASETQLPWTKPWHAVREIFFPVPEVCPPSAAVLFRLVTALLRFSGFVTVAQSMSALWGRRLGRRKCRGRRRIVIVARVERAKTEQTHTHTRRIQNSVLQPWSVYAEMSKICLIFKTLRLL